MTDKNVTPATDEQVATMKRFHGYGKVAAASIVQRDLLRTIARIDADAKVIEDYERALSSQELVSADLRSVCGPLMPCGCFAVQMQHCVGYRGPDGAWCGEHGIMHSTQTPEYLAWRESRRTQ